MNLFISPHLDDIALSCGGRVWELTRAGEPVVIVTLCAGDTPPQVADSPAVRRVHDEWRLGPNPYAGRRREDRRACRLLGARPVHLDLLDAVYRQDGAGRMLYSRKFIGARVKPWDHSHHAVALRAALAGLGRRYPGARVFAPLAYGAHIDHIIARAAIEAVFTPAQIVYYEDFPYAELASPDAWRSATDGLQHQTSRLSADARAARINAIGAYRSQLFALFRERDAQTARARMAERVGKYIAGVKGERYWRVRA
ncbi:MAG: PIG-L family deacetylase [Thermoflexales bacterium]